VVTGQSIEFPVQYVITGDRIVIFPGRPESKRWWRNLSHSAPVDILLRGTWQSGDGALLRIGDTGYMTPRWRAIERGGRAFACLDDSPLVDIRLRLDTHAPVDSHHGLPQFRALSAYGDRDIDWNVRENRKKARLAKLQ